MPNEYQVTIAVTPQRYLVKADSPAEAKAIAKELYFKEAPPPKGYIVSSWLKYKWKAIN